MSEVATLLKSLGDELKSVKDEVVNLKKKAPNQANPTRVFSIRNGENPMGSRGYSFLKAIGLATGRLTRDEAKVEADLHDKINASLKGQGFAKAMSNSFTMPFASSHFADDIAQESHDLVIAGSAVDPDELKALRKSYQKDMSWNIDTAGGTLVPAPAQGELIEYLRNKACLMEAGARVMPLPAQGSIALPKQTGASTAYWVGENTTITNSDLTTGDLLLKAKKLAARVLVPNELFRYSSPAADAMVREDLAKQLQLGLDTAGLTGVGSATTPKGIFNYSSINSYTPKKQGTNGDAFGPEDFFGMIGKVAAQNAIVNEESFAFIVRPELFFNIVAKRADAVSAGDRQGSFIQWSFDPQGNITYRAAGKRVVVSNQIAADRTKAGSGATLTRILGGDMSQWIIAMAAALEIDQNRYSDTAYTKDQTDVRAILQVDMGPRHEESFAVADYLRVDATSA